MANEEQLEILRKSVSDDLWISVDEWNRWREENPNTKIDLTEAILPEAILVSANLSRADLRNAYLVRAKLIEANLTEANLNHADFSVAFLWKAILVKADLSGANLSTADLSAARLARANLTRADLARANFWRADLNGCKFDKAIADGTIFADLDLGEAIGLENVVHRGPCTVGTDTIAISKGKIPEVFLRGCGLSDIDIEYAKLYNPDLSNEDVNKILYKIYDLRATQAIQIAPLFISYSHADSAFVDKLETYLNKKGIRFWRDIHDATSGRLEKVIDRAIRQNPTVLLILSENSNKSDWVEHEVRTARDLEKDLGRDVLCPVALDDSWKSSPWPKRIMEQVMEYNILPFSSWKDDAIFEQTFVKLIDGLQLFYKK